MPREWGEGKVISVHRIVRLIAICLMFVLSAPAVVHAEDENTNLSAEVERGKPVKIDVLAKRSAGPDAKLQSVTPKETDYGTAWLSQDGKSVSYVAKNRVGETTVEYKGRDDANSIDYNGKITISVVPLQRIVTFDATRVAGVLGIILVLAIVLEIGLTTLFNWKYFQENLLGRGLRTPIAIAVAAFFVFYYKLDTVSDLLSSFTGDPQSSFGKTTPGYIITAFIVAGGSSTVNQLFEKFGIRSPIQQPAQIVVEFNRQGVPSTAPVNVTIDGKLEGTVDSANRFPTAGKYRLDPGSHEIELEARDATGTAKKVKQTINVASGAEATVTMTI